MTRSFSGLTRTRPRNPCPSELGVGLIYLKAERLGPRDLHFDNAQFEFPNINFVRERTRFGHFNEGYDTTRAKVTAHLAVLDDHAHAILGAKEPPDTKKARFGSHGVEASGENANTKGDSKAMKQREVTVAGRVVVCDWHTKLRPHVDRIYFNATSLEYVVVGVFRDHLDSIRLDWVAQPGAAWSAAVAPPEADAHRSRNSATTGYTSR